MSRTGVGTCGVCDANDLRRVHRRLWMRLLPGSALLVCVRCGQGYLRLVGGLMFSMR
jgi:hypothetical protein